MNKQDKINEYLNWQKLLTAYSLGQQSISFDLQTIAPSKGKAYAIERMGILSGESYKILTDPKKNELINELLAFNDLEEDLKIELTLLKESKDDIACIPIEEYMQFNKLKNEANVVWEKAKIDNDYQSFKPYIEELFSSTLKVVEYRNKGDVFNQLINDYERGMSKEKYDEFFALMEKELLPLIKKIKSLKQPIDNSVLNKSVPIEVQREITNFICEYLGFDNTWGYFAESAHPFTSSFSKYDIRLTTKYHENDFISNIYAVIHELGHGIFGHQIADKYDGRFIANEITSGLHESQSRLLENYIGRSKAFWIANYDKLQSRIEFLKDVTLDDFYIMINLVEDSKIRIEADELSYPIHILIRYRIEEAIVNKEVTVDELPMLWNKYMKEYLDLDIDNDREGILQDVHWSYGYIGYFPTYALGSAYAAQFFNTMKKELNVDELLANNQFKVISNWLEDNIHQYAGLYTANELLIKVTKEEFNPSYYIEYLKDKYSKIYNI